MLSHAGAKAYVFTPSFRGFDYRTMAAGMADELASLVRISVRAGVDANGNATRPEKSGGPEKGANAPA